MPSSRPSEVDSFAITGMSKVESLILSDTAWDLIST